MGKLKVFLKIYGYIQKAKTLMKCWIKCLGKTNHIIDEDGEMFIKWNEVDSVHSWNLIKKEK